MFHILGKLVVRKLVWLDWYHVTRRSNAIGKACKTLLRVGEPLRALSFQIWGVNIAGY
jgi:hypothetical protein